MIIKRIYCDMLDYEVGKNNIVKIEPSDLGPKKNNMYKVTYEDGDLLFVGMFEHEVEYIED